MTDEVYKWFLRNEVVDAGLCTFCGACAAICLNGRIEFKADGSELKEEYARNGLGACEDVWQRVVTFASKISPNIFSS